MGSLLEQHMPVRQVTPRCLYLHPPQPGHHT
jgi:hypothetical protein